MTSLSLTWFSVCTFLVMVHLFRLDNIAKCKIFMPNVLKVLTRKECKACSSFFLNSDFYLNYSISISSNFCHWIFVANFCLYHQHNSILRIISTSISISLSLSLFSIYPICSQSVLSNLIFHRTYLRLVLWLPNMKQCLIKSAWIIHENDT